jgi:hypothetical protein
MTKLAIIGDVHHQWGTLNKILYDALINENADIVVQVGDMCYKWPRTPDYKIDFGSDLKFKTKVEETPMYWIDGNHENFDYLEQDKGASMKNWEYWPRGEVKYLEGIGYCLGIGGAKTPDIFVDSFIRNKEWWARERISSKNINTAIKNIKDINQPINIVFSHDHPNGFGYRLNGPVFLDCMRERELLRDILNLTNSPFWFFGHYHRYQKGQFHSSKPTKTTEWHCAPVLDYGKYLLLEDNKVQLISLKYS